MADPISIFPIFVRDQAYPPSGGGTVTPAPPDYSGSVHKQSIHNAIVNTISNGVFMPISYDTETKFMSVSSDVADAVPPQSVVANELSCSFGLPERNRRTRVRERGVWNWQAIVKFHREVVMEPFEEQLIADPILLAPDDDTGLRRISIHLISSEYVHPPKQGASSGTHVIYTLEARLGPI